MKSAFRKISRRLIKVLGIGIEDSVDQKVALCLSEHALIPCTKTNLDDVFVVGYPKSGNTWMQSLICGILFGVRPDLAPERLIQEIVPDLHYKKYYKRFGKTQCFKSHDLPSSMLKKVIYLVRDGRDVIVSYYHFLRATRDPKVSWDDFLADSSENIPFGSWKQHVTAWRENPFDADILWIKYEDLKLDPTKELTRVCSFIGVERSEEFLRQLCEQATFEKMRDRVEESGMDHPMPEEFRFFRKGQVGSHIDELPKNILKAFSNENFDELKVLGYLQKKV